MVLLGYWYYSSSRPIFGTGTGGTGAWLFRCAGDLGDRLSRCRTRRTAVLSFLGRTAKKVHAKQNCPDVTLIAYVYVPFVAVFLPVITKGYYLRCAPIFLAGVNVLQYVGTIVDAEWKPRTQKYAIEPNTLFHASSFHGSNHAAEGMPPSM